MYLRGSYPSIGFPLPPDPAVDNDAPAERPPCPGREREHEPARILGVTDQYAPVAVRNLNAVAVGVAVGRLSSVIHELSLSSQIEPRHKYFGGWVSLAALPGPARKVLARSR